MTEIGLSKPQRPQTSICGSTSRSVTSMPNPSTCRTRCSAQQRQRRRSGWPTASLARAVGRRCWPSWICMLALSASWTALLQK